VERLQTQDPENDGPKRSAGKCEGMQMIWSYLYPAMEHLENAEPENDGCNLTA